MHSGDRSVGTVLRSRCQRYATSSKFVSQPLVLPTVTVVQVAVHPVVMTARDAGASVSPATGLPAHDSVMVDGAVPPLYAVTLDSTRGARNANTALVGPGAGYEMLFEAKRPQGPERYHAPDPQSMPA